MEIQLTASQTTTSKRAAAKAVGRLFVLNLGAGQVLSINADGSGKKVLASDAPLPDGIVVDVEAGHIYWTNMGVPNKNDGYIERADLDGGNRKTIIPPGVTFTPKQLHLEKASGKLYWSDREGMRVMRANLDGSGVETLVQTGEGDADRRDLTKWCVGIAVDPDRGHIYWTHKGPDNAGLGRLCRAGIDIPKGQSATTRKDIEVLYDGLPDPIDIELDRENRLIYWTDRGDPPRGNTVNRAPMDAGRKGRPAPEILFTHLMEGIGIALDLKGGRMFMTDLGGSVYSAKLDGSRPTVVLMAQGNLSGIAYADIPATEI
jgi:hypothetical protein